MATKSAVVYQPKTKVVMSLKAFECHWPLKNWPNHPDTKCVVWDGATSEERSSYLLDSWPWLVFSDSPCKSASDVRLGSVVANNSISPGVTLHLMNLITISNGLQMGNQVHSFLFRGSDRIGHTDPDRGETVYQPWWIMNYINNVHMEPVIRILYFCTLSIIESSFPDWFAIVMI